MIYRTIRTLLYRHLKPQLYRIKQRIYPYKVRLVSALNVNMSKVKKVLSLIYGMLYMIFSSARSLQKKPKDLKLIVMIVISQVEVDPRVDRAARTLVNAGYRIKVYFPKHFSKTPDWGPGIEFFPVEGNSSLFNNHFPFVFGHLIFKSILNENPLSFHCHDLNTSMIGYFAAKLRKSYLLVDFHEWFSENVSWDVKSSSYVKHGLLKKYTYRFVERFVLKRSDVAITVCDSIAEMLKREFKVEKNINVIRNIPFSPTREMTVSGSDHDSKAAFDGSQKFCKFLYQGGVGPSRMLEPLIRAMKHTESCHFIIRGPGVNAYGQHYLNYAKEHGVEDKVFVLPPVKSSEVVAAAKMADVGIWTLPNLCANFYYALPNKIFEYITAELPILVAEYPEAMKIVKEFEIGLGFDPYDENSIAKAMNTLAADRILREKMSANTKNAIKSLNADIEWSKLSQIYFKIEESLPKSQSL